MQSKRGRGEAQFQPTGALVMSGTGLSRAASCCYPELNVAIDDIPVLFNDGRGRKKTTLLSSVIQARYYKHSRYWKYKLNGYF